MAGFDPPGDSGNRSRLTYQDNGIVFGSCLHKPRSRENLTKNFHIFVFYAKMGQIRPDRLKIKGGVRLTSGVEDFNHESHDIHEKGHESGQTHRDFRWVGGSKISKAVHIVK